MFNFWCECVQCLRGGVRFPNEVGVWWPSVYGEPNPKALHFQPWVGLGLLDRQALHYPHGSLAVRLKHKKKKNLPDAGFCLRYSIFSDFCRFGSRSEVIYWRGDLTLGNVLLVGRISVSITLFLFFQQVSTCREGKLGGFSLSFCRPSHLGLVSGCGLFFGPRPF